MLRSRIIPCLLVRDKGLVKTVGFGDGKYIGDPVNAVRIFNEKEVDELIVLDIDATVRGAEPDYTMIRRLAAEARMPVCYGGGVKSVEQAKQIVGSGIEKVAVSSALMSNPNLVREMANELGSQSVVVVLDAKRNGRRHEVWTHNGRRNSGHSVMEMASLAEGLGAGELVLNSIDNDGRMQGYDIGLLSEVWKTSRLPLTALGGAGSFEDIEALIGRYWPIGAGAGSLFVFKGAYRAVLINYPSREMRERLVAAGERTVAASI